MDDELSRINRELAEARQLYQTAKTAFRLAADLHGDLEISNSDGVASVRKAKVLLDSAWDRYQEALLGFANYRGKHGP